jgi:ribosomal protein S18 acetylase RimI-like enzyme
MLNSETTRDQARDTGGGFSIRRATPDDAPALAAAASRFFRDTFGAANRPENMEHYLSHAFSETRQRAELEDSGSRILIAAGHEAEIVGYVHLRLGAPPPAASSAPPGRPAEISRLYADRRLHGRGLGAALMDAAVTTAAQWGAELLWLGVWEENPRAIAFYAKHGFVDVGEQDFLLGSDLQHDRIMARRLTGSR